MTKPDAPNFHTFVYLMEINCQTATYIPSTKCQNCQTTNGKQLTMDVRCKTSFQSISAYRDRKQMKLLTNREELSFRFVFAFPNAAKQKC